MDRVSMARLLTAAVIPIEFGLMSLYLFYRDRLARHGGVRLLVGGLLVLVLLLVPVVQYEIFRKVARVRQIDDGFIWTEIIAENVAIIVLIVLYALRSRR